MYKRLWNKEYSGTLKHSQLSTRHYYFKHACTDNVTTLCQLTVDFLDVKHYFNSEIKLCQYIQSFWRTELCIRVTKLFFFAFFFKKKLNISTYTWFDQSFVHDVVQKLSFEWYRKTKDKIEAYIFNDVRVKFPKNSPSWCLFIENLFLLCSSCITYITI